MTKKYYTYYLHHRPTGLKYYGVKYSETANPSELWVSYFSSSSYVHRLIEMHGKDSFDISIRKIFSNKKKAILWEKRFLSKIDAKNRKDWLNMHNGDRNFFGSGRPVGFAHTEETKRKISESNIGKHDKILSDETKEKISKGMKETLSKLSDEEKIQKVLNSCCAPHTYTKERSRKISKATTGVKKTKTKKLLRAEEERRNRTPEQKSKCGDHNRGKTWKLIDGKRVWMETTQ